MKKLTTLLPLLFVATILFAQDMTTEEYIVKYQELAIEEMHRSGVPAAITLAQGILESGSGNSNLVKMSNNHFGIKCKTGWTGPSVKKDDDRRNECFRAYHSAVQSYRDHSDFLRNSSRYASLFNLDPDDYQSWARGLKKAGYATDPQYANRLIQFIEKYDLNRYTVAALQNGNPRDIAGGARIFYEGDGSRYSNGDVNSQHVKKEWVVARYPVSEIQSQNISKSESRQHHATRIVKGDAPYTNNFTVIKINSLKVVKVAEGTSLLRVATRFKVKLSKLLEWNELDRDGILAADQNIFLEKKRTLGSKESVVTEREASVYEVAQEYGIQTSSLCDYNGVDKSGVFSSGSRVYLQPRQQSTAMK